MASNITVRTAKPDDVGAIQSVARRSWDAAYEGVLGEDVVNAMLEGGYAEDSLRSVIESSVAALFVATDDDEVVGYANGEPGEEGDADGEVSVYVDPDYWGEGIGGRLLEQATDHLADQGVERVRDSVLAENEVGNAFYERHFDQVDQQEVDILGETHTANVYAGDIG